jgi:hypothetical protein
MSPVFSDRAALPWRAIVIALLVLSPLPMAFPSGITLAAMGLVGSALLLQQSRQPDGRRIALRPAARKSWTSPNVRRRRGGYRRMPS